MNRNQKLFDLIISMSISEKSFFKKISNNHSLKPNQYIKLFDAIKKQNEWDEEKLLKKLKNEPFIKHFSVTKNYLYQALLQSLETYYRDNIPKAQLFQYHNQIQVLIHKRLFKQAGQLLKKAKSIAKKEQYHDVLCQLNQQQLSLLIESEDLTKISKDLEQLDIEFKNHAKQHQLQYDFLQLSAKFLVLLRKGKKSNKQEYQADLDWIRSHPLLQQPPDFGTITENTRYYNLKAMLAIFDNKIEEAHPLLEQHLAIFEQHPKIIIYNPLNYVQAYQNLINNCRRLKKQEQLEQLVKKMRQIPKQYKFKDKENIIPIVLIRSYAYEASFYFETQQYDKLEQIILELEKDLKTYKHKMEKIWLLVLSYNIAEYYFNIKNDLEKSIHWLHIILNDKEEQIAPRYQLSARLLQICIHLHLGHEQLVEHKIRETKSYMKKYAIDAFFIKKMLKHLNKINFSINKSERKTQLQEMKATHDFYKKTDTEFLNWLIVTSAFLRKENA